MYSIKVEPPDDTLPVINRSMSANEAIELLPVITAICKHEYNFSHPIISPLGNSRYHIYDRDKPSLSAIVTIVGGV